MIAVIVAMKEELEGIVSTEALLSAQENTFPFPYIESTSNVVFILSGVGKSNAAAAAQWACDVYSPDVIINFGTAGALSTLITPNDIVIASGSISADADLSAFGHNKGYISGVGAVMPSSPGLVRRAVSIARLCKCKYHTGLLATSDAFIASQDKALELSRTFSAVACDMEAAAIAQIAYRNKVDFLAIKKISDNADDGAGATFEMLEKGRDIAIEAKQVVAILLGELG